VSYLLALVRAQGHTDFRDARGPLRLSQRQAGGRFTTQEASALIDRLVSSTSGGGDNEDAGAEERAGPQATEVTGTRVTEPRVTQPRATGPRATEPRATEQPETADALVRGLPVGLLVAELERRGWRALGPQQG